MKKVLEFTLALCILACSFSGCIKKNTTMEDETDSVETEEIITVTEEEIVEKFYETYDFWTRWIYGSYYCEDREFIRLDFGPRLLAVREDAPIQTTKELEDEMKKHFTDEMCADFFKTLSPEDREGRLYIYDSEVGDTGEVIDAITVEMVDDKKYRLTLDIILTFTEEKYQKTVYYLYENGRWVFEDDEEEVFYNREELPKYLDKKYAPYNEVLRKYYATLYLEWDDFSSEGLTDIIRYYLHDEPLEKLGFSLIDINEDGKDELIIGEITDGLWGKVIYDIYTEKDGSVYQVALGWERNRYYLCEEDDGYIIANEGSSGAANNVAYYYILKDRKLELVEGVVMDGFASPDNPWFKTTDTDHDISNDEHIDEETYWKIIESYEAKYITPDYIPFNVLG